MATLASLLVRATESPILEPSQGDMLGLATGCSCPPQTEGRRLEFSSHQRDHLARRQTELLANRVEARAILPCHLDDTIYFHRWRFQFRVHACLDCWELLLWKMLSGARNCVCGLTGSARFRSILEAIPLFFRGIHAPRTRGVLIDLAVSTVRYSRVR